MTSLMLSLWIASAIVLQLVIYLGVIYWHHRVRYQLLSGNKVEASPAQEISQSREISRQQEIFTHGDEVATGSRLRTFKVTKKIVEDELQSVCSFYLAPADGQPLASFHPGQFLTFQLDVASTTGSVEFVTRCYSLSDAPHPDYYRITIKRTPAAGISSHCFHDQVAVGSELKVRAPSGHFYLEPGDDPVVLIGGGIGITPLLSMINWSLSHQPEREIWLFYGVRDSRELVMKSHLESLAMENSNFHLWFCLSKDPCGENTDANSPRDHYHQGRVDINLLRAQLSLKPYQFYLCGPTAMLESLVPALDNWGVQEDHIHFEAFGPSSIKRANKPLAEPTGTEDEIWVNFAQSGKRLRWQSTDASLLEFAEANDIAIDSGCRAGCCGSCQTRLSVGEVNYLQSPEFELEAGNCLPCVCTPKNNLTLEL